MNIRRQCNSTSFALAGFIILIAGVSASAHPLGNFSINHFSRIEIGSEHIRVRYVIDLAEFPTFQAFQSITGKPDGYPSREQLDAYGATTAAEYLKGLLLFVDQQQYELKIQRQKVTIVEGSAGPTMRVECDLLANINHESNLARHLEYQDTNFTERIGWREIVVTPLAGISVFESSAFSNAITDELKSYPADMLSSPLNERAAQLSFTNGSAPVGARALLTRDGRPTAPPARDRLAELIRVREITLGIGLLSLLIAIMLGALHALSPGHGKTIVAAYLVGSRGTAGHAAFLGLTVTITHTAGVFGLGIATLVASEYIVPERLFPYLSLVSGAIVAGLGCSLLIRRLQALVAFGSFTHTHDGHTHVHDGSEELDHEHEHGHAHTHGGQTHSHLPPGSDGSAVTWRSLLALGISGGLLPCPSALMVMLSAISWHHVAFGLLLVIAFSMGLAGTLTTVGLFFVYARQLITPRRKFGTIVRVLPIVSALVIACAGLAIFYAALSEAGFHLSQVINQVTASR